MDPALLPELLVAAAAFLGVVVLAVSVLLQARPGRALATCRRDLDELRERVEELREERRRLEAALGERQRLLEEAEHRCDKRVQEAARMSGVAETIVKAIRAGAIALAARECRGRIIVEPGKVLCEESGGLRVLWPEKASVGEELLVVEAEGDRG